MTSKQIEGIIPERYRNPSPLVPVTEGASGAYVYSSGGKYIVKAALREGLDSWTWTSFVREHDFYTRNSASGIPFIPGLEYADACGDYVLLVMEMLEPLPRAGFEEAGLSRVIGLLTDINACPADKIYVPPRESGESAEPEDDGGTDKSQTCLTGWLEVLGEHGSLFDADIMHEIASGIEDVLELSITLPEVLNHGDFHLGNILVKGDGTLAACDWQNVGREGASGDLSFLLSRAGADGLHPDITRAVKEYCAIYSEKSGHALRPDTVYISMAKSDLGLGFYCWHEYLHGADADRVRNIYDKMVKAYRFLKSQ